MSSPFALNPDETEIIGGSANKIGFLMSGSGKVVLTNQRFLFCNRRKTKINWECGLNDIMYVGPARNMNIFAFLLIIPLLINSAVKISLRNGDSQRFVVMDKTQWISMLNEYRSKLA